MTNQEHIVLAAASMVLLTFVVGARLLSMRIKEMKASRIHPQSVALSAERKEKLKDSRASDNYNHLYEAPVLFYALCACALATSHTPNWLVICAWAFVLLRVAHSFIQCTYNKVVHRLYVFLAGLFCIVGAWIAFAVSFINT